eukprot:TRINITY_DN27903_c0_g1_i1.p1 TRINITY_DN27903_c0_g1~~TRINITY_DN27903_c0_g1_i1.p1  ORF type:complete len:660 (-),score=214.83 TRINITY_DN27903_c0_g1_i1:190-2169(-)
MCIRDRRTRDSNLAHRSRNQLSLHFFSLTWRTFHVLLSSYDTLRTALFEPVPSRPVHQPAHPPPLKQPPPGTAPEAASPSKAASASPRSPKHGSALEFEDADSGDEQGWSAGFPFQDRLNNIINDATVLVTEVSTLGWFEEQLDTVLSQAVLQVQLLEQTLPALMAQVYRAGNPLSSSEGATGTRRVFQGHRLQPEQKQQLQPKQVHQIVLHQALSVLEVQQLTDLFRAMVHSVVSIAQIPIRSALSRVVGTMLSVDLSKDFDALAERLVSPIADCFSVNERMAMGDTALSAQAWNEQAVALFGSKLHRALRFVDAELLKHEERFFVAHALLSVCSIAFPTLHTEGLTSSHKLQALSKLVSKSDGALMKLLMAVVDMRDDSPTMAIQEAIESVLSCDFINARIVAALRPNLGTEWQQPRCAAEVSTLEKNIGLMPTEAARAEERYKLARVLLVEMCEQAAGGEHAMATPKLEAIVLTVHELLQHSLFLKHVLFTVTDELLHIVRQASSEGKIAAALARSVDEPTEAVCLLDCLDPGVTHYLLTFLVKLLADSRDGHHLEQTWSQQLVGGAAWAAKYVAPLGLIKDMLEAPLRKMCQHALPVDTQQMVVQLLDRIQHEFILDTGERGLASVLLKALPSMKRTQAQLLTRTFTCEETPEEE